MHFTPHSPFVKLYTANSFTGFTIRNNHPIPLSATWQCFINPFSAFTQCTLTSFNNRMVFSMSSRFGGSRARASRAFGSPMLNTLVCRTSFSNGQRYRKSHSQLQFSSLWIWRNLWNVSHLQNTKWFLILKEIFLQDITCISGMP